MATLLIVVLAIVVAFLLRLFGFFKNLVFSWDLVFRWFLYILIFLGVLGVLSKAWSIFVILAHLNPAWLISPSQNIYIDGVSTIVYALALWGIWRFKKWGAYLVFVRLAFTIVVQIFIYHSLSWQLAQGYTGLDNLYADLSGAVTWLIAFFFLWKYFT